MEKICVVCNNKFVTNYSFKKYCSGNCGNFSVLERNKKNQRWKKYYILKRKEKDCFICNKKYIGPIHSKICRKQECKEQYRRNKFKISYKENKEKISLYRKKHDLENKENIWRQKKIRLDKDIDFRIITNMRVRLQQTLKYKRKKVDKTINLLGCSIIFLRQYLEKQFKPGMNWQNYGCGNNKWNIDHILPITSFNLKEEYEQRKCFHYTNLQPLWHSENSQKSNKIMVSI